MKLRCFKHFIHEIGAEHGLRLASAEPHLAVAFNRIAPAAEGADRRALVVAEPGGFTLVQAGPEGMGNVASRRCDVDDDERLAAALGPELVNCAAGGTVTTLYVTGARVRAIDPTLARRVECVREPVPASRVAERYLAMVLP